jgi:hypothetical protein
MLFAFALFWFYSLTFRAYSLLLFLTLGGTVTLYTQKFGFFFPHRRQVYSWKLHISVQWWKKQRWGALQCLNKNVLRTNNMILAIGWKDLDHSLLCRITQIKMSLYLHKPHTYPEDLQTFSNLTTLIYWECSQFNGLNCGQQSVGREVQRKQRYKTLWIQIILPWHYPRQKTLLNIAKKWVKQAQFFFF